MGHSFYGGLELLPRLNKESRELQHRLGERHTSNARISHTSICRNSMPASQPGARKSEHVPRAAGTASKDDEQRLYSRQCSTEIIRFLESEPPPQAKRNSIDNLLSSGSFIKRRLRQSLKGRRRDTSDLATGSSDLKRTRSGVGYRAIRIPPNDKTDMTTNISYNAERTRESEEFPIRTVSGKGASLQDRKGVKGGPLLGQDMARSVMSDRQSPATGTAMTRSNVEESLSGPRLPLPKFENDGLGFETALEQHSTSKVGTFPPHVNGVAIGAPGDSLISNPIPYIRYPKQRTASQGSATEARPIPRGRSVHFSAVPKIESRHGYPIPEIPRARPASRRGSPTKSLILKPQPPQGEAHDCQSPTRLAKRNRNGRFPVHAQPTTPASQSAIVPSPTKEASQVETIQTPTTMTVEQDNLDRVGHQLQKEIALSDQKRLSSVTVASLGPPPALPLPPIPAQKPDTRFEDLSIHRGTPSSPIMLSDSPSPDTTTPAYSPGYNTPCTLNSPPKSPDVSPPKLASQGAGLHMTHNASDPYASRTSSTRRNAIAGLSQEHLDSIRNKMAEAAPFEPGSHSDVPSEAAVDKKTSECALGKRTLSRKALKKKHIEEAMAQKRHGILPAERDSRSSGNLATYQAHSPARSDSYRRNRHVDTDTLASSNATDDGEERESGAAVKDRGDCGVRSGIHQDDDDDDDERGIDPLFSRRSTLADRSSRLHRCVDDDLSGEVTHDDNDAAEDTEPGIVHLPSPDDDVPYEIPYPVSIIASYKQHPPPPSRPPTPAGLPHTLLPGLRAPSPRHDRTHHPAKRHATSINAESAALPNQKYPPIQAPLPPPHPVPPEPFRFTSFPTLPNPMPPCSRLPHPFLPCPSPPSLPKLQNAIPPRRAVTVPGMNRSTHSHLSYQSSPHFLLPIVPPKAASTSLQSPNTAAGGFTFHSLRHSGGGQRGQRMVVEGGGEGEEGLSPFSGGFGKGVGDGGDGRGIEDGRGMGGGRNGKGERRREGEEGTRSARTSASLEESKGARTSGLFEGGSGSRGGSWGSRKGEMAGKSEKEGEEGELKARVRDLEERVLQLEAWIFRRFVEGEGVEGGIGAREREEGKGSEVELVEGVDGVDGVDGMDRWDANAIGGAVDSDMDGDGSGKEGKERYSGVW